MQWKVCGLDFNANSVWLRALCLSISLQTALGKKEKKKLFA